MARTSRILAASNSSSTTAPPPSPAVNVESDMVIILAALLCALICMVGLIAVARCAWLRRSNGTAARTPSQASANKGIKKKNLQLLPKFTYTAAITDGGGPANKFASSECAICLGEFIEGDEIRVLPHCGHGFHLGCVDTWLGSHSSCPSCRQILVVARCQKCGQFPAVSSSSCGGASSTEAELKAGHSSNNNNSRNNNATFLP